MVIWVVCVEMRRGLGLGPNPLLPQHYTIHFKYKFYTIVVKNYNVGGLVARPCQVFRPDRRSRVRLPVESINFSQNQPMEGCHVAAQDWAMWHHTIPPKYATCQFIHDSSTNTCLPSQCMPLYLPCHCMVVWPVQSAATSALYGLYSHHFFCMFGKTNRRDIFRIRCLFEPVQVVLGSYRRGLHTRLF
jgi:hypothetical protein